MIAPRHFFESLTEFGVTFFVGVPDSLLKEFCAIVSDTLPPERHVIAANEGCAVALAAGVQVATGKVPVVYLQNSGFGNAVNPLLSLADPRVFAIPMVVLIGWRGEPGTTDEPQHMVQGQLQERLQEVLELPHRVLGPESDPHELARWAVGAAQERGGPAVILVRKGTFSPQGRTRAAADAHYPSREAVIEVILEHVVDRDLVVSTTGMASREVFEIRERRGEGHFRDFLTVGSMGHASSIALGMALSLRHRRVWCLDGDGAALMHLGAMTTIGTSGASNLVHVVFNNAAHDSVGGQPTVGRQVDFRAIARACGYRFVDRATSLEELRQVLRGVKSMEAPTLLEVWVRKGARSDLGRPTSSPQENKAALQQFVWK